MATTTESRRATRRLHIVLAGPVALLLVLAGCGGGDDDGASDAAGTSDAPTTTNPSNTGDNADDQGGDGSEGAALGEVETVVGGLEVPWAVAFVDDDTFLVTERPGRVRVVEGGELHPTPVAEVDAVAQGEGGLLGIALHPSFDEERFAYLYYTAGGENRVVRHPVRDDLTFGPEEVVLDGIPAARFHNGGRIAFGPDDLLYVTTGDATDPFLAPDLDSLAGKILRLAPDGSVPADNPFDGSPVWSYGHRNPQGLGWDDDGNLYASEHGPTGELGLCCHDEVNLITRGGFYGWPYVAGEVAAAEGDPPEQPIEPVVASGEDTWAPAGVAVIGAGEVTHLLVANLAAEQLLRIVAAAEDPAEVEELAVALDGFGRLRAATTGPDGCVYLTTSNTDGRGQPAEDDDRILRTCPSAAG